MAAAMAQQEEKAAGIPEWVVTFGDMMSLLLTFFIMLVSMSEIKEEELYQAMVEAMRRRFGHEMSAVNMIPGVHRPRNSVIAKIASMGRARRMDTMNGGDKVKAPVGEHPRVKALRDADHTAVGSVILFKTGGVELTEKHKRTLQSIAQKIGGKQQKIEIRGHTSLRPLAVDSPYKDHRELSWARCRVAEDYLIKLGINPKRLRLAAAGDSEPRHRGTDPLLRKENPRVEIFQLNELTEDLEGTVEERRQRFSEEEAP